MAQSSAPEWETVASLHTELGSDIVHRAERATRAVNFALPSDKVFDLSIIYPDEIEDILEQDSTLIALAKVTAEHAYQLEERAERIRTRRTIVVLSLLSLQGDSSGPDRPSLAA